MSALSRGVGIGIFLQCLLSIHGFSSSSFPGFPYLTLTRVNTSDVLAVGTASTGDPWGEGLPWFYLNDLEADTIGEQILSGPKVTKMNLLTNNCTVGFQLYIGDGPQNNFGGIASLNIGAGSACLLANPYAGYKCGGIGIQILTTSQGSTIGVIGSGDSSNGPTASFPYNPRRGTWSKILIYLNTLDSSGMNKQRTLAVYVNGKLVSTQPIPWSVTDLNSGGDSGSWSQKLTFLGSSCQTGNCVDNHIVKDVYFLCGKGPLPPPIYDSALAPLDDNSTLVPTPSPTPSPTPFTTPELIPSPLPTPSPTPNRNQPTPKVTLHPTPKPPKTAKPNIPTCQVPDPWVFPLDHMKLVYDAKKNGRAVYLTENSKNQFGLGLLTPAISNLVGFGEFAVNLTFNLTVKVPNSCSGLRFVVDYGAKKSCLYSEENIQPQNKHIWRPSPQPQPNGGQGGAILPPPDFQTKPIPWPCPPGSCPCEDDEEQAMLMQFNKKSNDASLPVSDDFKVPECDGISLALVSDSDGSGIYVAKEQSLVYAGELSVTANMEVEIKLVYTRTKGVEFMTFYINGNKIADQIPFTTSDLAQGSRLFPKVSFAAGTGSTCQAEHAISAMWIQMEKVLSCREVEILNAFNPELTMINLESLLADNKEDNLARQMTNQNEGRTNSTTYALRLVVVAGPILLIISLSVWKEEIRRRSKYLPISI